MRRQLGWLCLLPALATLASPAAGQALGVAAAAPVTPVTNAAAAAPALVAGSDYPLATWVPANPANYSYGNRPHDYPVQMIIIHDTESSYAAAIQDFQDPTRAGSAHYVVSFQGDITQMVYEHDIAWHAGNWDYNTRAIGIEHEGYVACCYFTAAEYDASARLAASICSRWGVPMDRTHVIGHNEVPDPNNPGLYGGEEHHTDPGPYWDWATYMSLAQGYANALPSPPRMMPDPVAVLNSQTSATVTWQTAQTCHSPITGYTVTGQPGNVTMSVPGSATSATFTGLQAGVNYTFAVTATNPDGNDTLTAHWRCSTATMGASPASPQPSGSTVQLSSTSAGCPNPLYQFWVLAPGSSTWTVAHAYSSNASLSWNTTGLVAGTYHLSVWARDTTSSGVLCGGLGCYDAFFPGITYTLTTTPCASATSSAAPASPSGSGTTVTFTPIASGCPHPLYEFWILAPGGSWTIARPYSASAAFNWNTIGLAGGTYSYSVWARDSGSANSYEAFFPGTAYTLTTTTCASVTASAAPASPQGAGTTVTVTASASGCSNARFEFWTLAPGGSWTVAQPYSAGATFNWNTTGAAAGTYYYSVWVRDASSGAAYDAYFPGTTYVITVTPCASVTASAAPASPQAHGTTITITGSASGCPNARYEFWILTPGSSTWTMVRAYSAGATFNWTTTGLPAGTYRYSVWVHDASSAAGYDAYFPGAAYTLT
jgi:N-acetylmuramoyl-L-alanine amidase